MSARVPVGGAPLALPPGAAWRVEGAEIEVYAARPGGRSLVALVPPGAVIVPLPGVALVLVADDAVLVATDAGSRARAAWIAACAGHAAIDWRGDPADVAGFAVALTRGFDAREDRRDARLLDRLAEGAGTDAAPLARAIGDVARSFGIAAAAAAGDGRAAADLAGTPALARLAGMRAARVMLPPGWTKDDGGPLIVRPPGGGAPLAAIWSSGRYRDAADVPFGPERGADPVAYRLFAPLAHDVTRIAGMARHVAGDLTAREIAPLLGAAVATALVGLLVPLAVAWLFDAILPAGESGLLVAVGIALGAAAIVTALLVAVRTVAASRLSGQSALRLAAGVADRLLRLRIGIFRTAPAGDLDRRIAAIEPLRALVAEAILSGGMTLLLVMVYLTLLLVYAPPIAAVAVALSLVQLAAVVVGRAAQARSRAGAAAADGALAGLTYELLDGVAKLRAAAAEPRMLARWLRTYRFEQATMVRGDRIAIHVHAFTDAWQILSLLALFVAGVLGVRAGLTPGFVVGMIAAAAILQASVAALAELLARLFAARPPAERARPILAAAQEETAGRSDPGILTGRIEVSGLSFAYPGTGARLIDDLGFVLRPGEHLAIVGASGSGKSTLLRLLLGFERPTSGTILYDGQDLAGLDPGRLRAQVGVVLQTSQLFAGTIQENIRGASEASHADCAEAAERAGLGPDLATMPMGLHTPVTEGAGTLSGGQRQRVLVARALAARPRLLLLDEATSALDNVAQAVVADTLDRLATTRITVAHRLSTVRNADIIGVLAEGRLVETGRFAELMAQDGRFAALARRQLLED